MRPALALAFLLFTGCASTPPGPSAVEASPDRRCVEGVAIASGTDFAPRTLVRSGMGSEVEMRGRLVPNVRLLTGATVVVCGTGPASEGALTVESVDIVAVDGVPAYLGHIRDTSSGHVLDRPGRGVPLRLTSVPMSAQTTSELVWVSGRPNRDGVVEVVSFGLVRGWVR